MHDHLDSDNSCFFTKFCIWRNIMVMLSFMYVFGLGCANITQSVPPTSRICNQTITGMGESRDLAKSDTSASTGPTVRIYFGKRTYTGLDLMNIAKQYASQKEIHFDWNAASCTVWIKPRNSGILAVVSFDLDIGKPFLHILIDREGRAVSHKQGIAVD